MWKVQGTASLTEVRSPLVLHVREGTPRAARTWLWGSRYWLNAILPARVAPQHSKHQEGTHTERTGGTTLGSNWSPHILCRMNGHQGPHQASWRIAQAVQTVWRGQGAHGRRQGSFPAPFCALQYLACTCWRPSWSRDRHRCRLGLPQSCPRGTRRGNCPAWGWALAPPSLLFRSW